jgi:dihydroflavonol-4-reductase
VRLLDAGYRVRTTLRSLGRVPDVKAMLARGGAASTEAVTFAVADLTCDQGWGEAVAGCDFVLHVASPFPMSAPAHEDDLIVPARDGSLRVLRAARGAGVRRVVLTSSVAAVGYGHPPTDRPYDETSWTDVAGGVTAYAKSKTLAERAAWDFVEQEGKGPELSTVNPAVIFGPALGPDYSTSVRIIAGLLGRTTPRLSRMSFGVVDVRDVADLHLRAMTNPAAAGQRFIATSGPMSLQEVALALKTSLGNAAGRVATKVAPDWLVRLTAVFDPTARAAVPWLGPTIHYTSEKAKRVLGWAPRPKEEAVVATAEAVVRLGLTTAPR